MCSRCHLTSLIAVWQIRALKLDNGENRKRLLARLAFSVSTQEGIRRADTEALLQPRGALSGGQRPSTFSVNVIGSIVPILRDGGEDVKNRVPIPEKWRFRESAQRKILRRAYYSQRRFVCVTLREAHLPALSQYRRFPMRSSLAFPLLLPVLFATLMLSACTKFTSPPPDVAENEIAPIAASIESQPLVLPAFGPRTSVTASVPKSGGELIADSTPPPFETFTFNTNFARRTIEWEEIVSGGPPKDGIPAIDEPTFETTEVADEWLDDAEPVILFQQGETARAYPLSILIWHEIVNDEVEGQPVAITFCPLCNASITFDRNFDGQVLDFGTTGRLRNSDLIMYDRQSESWWQQFTGEGLVGEYAGEQLTFLPSQVIAWGDFKRRFPDGEVLARPSASRPYGENPYVGYDGSADPFLFRGKTDPRLIATERVAGLTTASAAKAYPFTLLAERSVIEDEFNGQPIVVFHKAGTTSALDARHIRDGKDVGAVAVFDRRVDGQLLSFRADTSGIFTDVETQSTWNILGEAISGPLAGTRLTEIAHFDHFWFAWAAFFPETELYAE